MAKYAGIVVDISLEKLDRVFDYKIPAHLENVVHPGMLVWIPFGVGNRKIKGFVVSLSDICDYEECKVKEISGVCEGAMTVEGQLIELAAWMRERYGCTMNQAMKTVLPVKNKIKEQTKILVTLAADENAVRVYAQNNKRAKAKIRLLQTLLTCRTMEKERLLESACTTAAVLKELQESGMVTMQSETVYRLPKIAREEKKNIILNDEQQKIVDDFRKDYKEGKQCNYLLHGVTGSGKTEVYMGMLETVLSEGKQAIVLIPEIALTYQTVMRFYGRFGDKVSVIHSKMSPGERYDQMERAKHGEISVMIGPRSAVFTPFSNLGLIIIDEEHEGAYKSETSPRYHAREVAQMRAQMNDASLVLGSATPSMESYFRALHGDYKLLHLHNRAKKDSKLANVHVVDLREELAEGNRSMFSRKLRERIEDRLQRKEQIMLFMNRRGYANFVSCRSCGEAMRCPHCDVSLTYHLDGTLRCHYCGYMVRIPKQCPECGSPFIAPFGTGTQKLEEMTKKTFPDARVLRMDADTTAKKGAHEEILQAFAEGEADILLGTQMIVKGHDFPKVTLVGIMAADLSLYAPDFRSAERTFELLTQASGRAGRSELTGDVVIQSYAPDHFAITAAAEQDYEQFYRQELLYRKTMGYPPAVGILGITLSSRDERLLIQAMEFLNRQVLKEYCFENLTWIGPVDAVPYKLNDIYRKILYIKNESYDILLKVRKSVQIMEESLECFKYINFQYDL